MSVTSERRVAASVWQRAANLAKRVLLLELRIYANIGRFVARRPAIARGAAGFSYHKPVFAVLMIFIVLSAVEIPIIDLVVHRWPAVRIVMLVLGIWGVTWMFGLLCGYLMRPMTVGPDGIRVREGLELDVELTWDDIASVSRRKQVDEPKSPRIETTDASRTLALRMHDETNITIELERPTVVRLPGRAPKGGDQEITALRLWVDDPKGFLDEVRRHL
ncbi:PH domain-containing protein [Agromyces sp. Leaf222]|uniref:PH domain-containing protein n=1 Tax=Agromyces sp. Leaf222 TaxID=1735688 RepID=UPI0006FFCEC8|nr:PH domain-containing protein [Agromyces sp. Leaf222]KQM83801.1 hypothetical protein ASE68_11805 [Agromyces sp. Leaf222]